MQKIHATLEENFDWKGLLFCQWLTEIKYQNKNNQIPIYKVQNVQKYKNYS